MKRASGGVKGGSTVPGGRRLIYFSSVPFHTYAQRPHFMVGAFLANDFDSVLWVDPYPTRFPTLADFRRLGTKTESAPDPAMPGVEVIKPAAIPIEPLPFSGALNHWFAWSGIRDRLASYARAADYCVVGVGRPSRLAQWALSSIPHARSFADILDNFPAFYRGLSKASMAARLASVCRQATDVYCSSTRIAEDIRRIRPDASIVLNGYNTEHLPMPTDFTQRSDIGYIGSIADWFDWPIVCSIARALPEVTVRLIGPEFVPRPRDLPSNVEFLGERPQSEVAALARRFAGGLIPFRRNALTDGVDPIKFDEYRSLGLPIWSTGFGEMRTRGVADGVMHVTADTDWRALWERAAASAPAADAVTAFRSEIDWGRRFAVVVGRALGTEQSASQPSPKGVVA